MPQSSSGCSDTARPLSRWPSKAPSCANARPCRPSSILSLSGGAAAGTAVAASASMAAARRPLILSRRFQRALVEVALGEAVAELVVLEHQHGRAPRVVVHHL